MQSSALRVTVVVAFACLTAAALRLGMWLPNIAAVGALALYCGSRLHPSIAWVPPLAVMAVTDLLLERMYGLPPFNRAVYACFILEVLLGRLLIRRPSALNVVAGGMAGAVMFYLLTNFEVWRMGSDSAAMNYPQTLAGLLACYTAGLPFFGYTLLGNLTFSAVFFSADAALAPATSPATESGR